MIAHFALSMMIRLGLPPNYSKARRWQASHVSTVWCSTISAYW
ncbi:hypothetical protein ACS0YX_35690 [Burkholderia gladioli]